MKRSELSRATPLLRKTPLTSSMPLARSSLSRNAGPKVPAKPKRARDTGPDKATAVAVLDRDGWCCVRCGGALWGVRGVEYSLQHRRARGMGGSRRGGTNAPQNLIGLCGSATTGCHGWVESNRAEAESNGWAVKFNSDPLLVPVAHWERGLIWLLADGGWSSRPLPTTTTPEEG